MKRHGSADRRLAMILLLCFFTGNSLLMVWLGMRSEDPQLLLEIANSAPATAQVFFNTGRGFTEDESVKLNLPAGTLDQFRSYPVTLPTTALQEIRFDPASGPGTFRLRRLTIRDADGRSTPLQIRQIVPFHQIAQIRQVAGGTWTIVTTEGADDPGIKVEPVAPIQAGRTLPGAIAGEARPLAFFNALFLPALWLGWRSRHLPARTLPGTFLSSLEQFQAAVNAPFSRLGERWSDADFIRFDALALWFYLLCAVGFVGSVALDWNGSSSEVLHSLFKRGGSAQMVAGEAQGIRSDEWGYATPDVLSQAFRADRFQVADSDLGNHAAALLGNLPVSHPATLLRPQFWGFFVLPVEYGYSFFWQCKAFLLLVGVFSWILWLSGSSSWGAAGALWFLFSPSTQWSYSWPSGLPEMIGLSCLAMVAFAYLLVGRNRRGLLVASVVATVAAFDFGLGAYLPQMIPLVWIQIGVLVAWCWGMRSRIVAPQERRARLIAIGVSLLVCGAWGAVVYRDVHTALAAIAATIYPGHRRLSGGTFSVTGFLIQLLPWDQTEHRFPPLLGNVSEGSGFLWLAPLTLLCLPGVSFSRPRRALFAGLGLAAAGITAWLLFPIPAAIGSIFGLDRTFAARCLPALGLANIALVSICLANYRFDSTRPVRAWLLRFFVWGAATAAFLLVFARMNATLQHFFTRGELIAGSVCLGMAAMLMVASRHRLLILALVGSQAYFFAGINPIERGVHVFTSSELFRFVQSQPDLRIGKWLIYTNQPTLSGLFAGVGCEIYTGTRYVPDIDHFPLLAARGLDLNGFNRLGYLMATLPEAGGQTKVDLLSPVIVNWKIAPTDPLLRQIGIRYLAFDVASEPPPVGLASSLKRLADHPIDGFWLYALP